MTPWVNVGLQDQGVLALVVDPGHETIVYAGTLNDGVFKTTNGGANWVANNTRMTGSFVTALAIDPVSPSTLYAASGPTVFKTTNGGASWAAINTGLPAPLYVDALAVAPSSPSTVHAGTGADGVFVLAPQ